MSSKRGIPKVAGVVLVCVGVAVSVVIVIMTLSTMGTMRDDAVRAKTKSASTQATTVVTPVTEAATEAATGDVPATTDVAPATPESATTEGVPVATNGNEQQVVVESDDTLSGLSREYGRSVDAIANHNGIRDVNLIYDGSVLVIPESCDGY